MRQMNSESADSITLRIWNRSTMGRTLDDAVQELATRAGTSMGNIVVTRSGPNTFTASLRAASAPRNQTDAQLQQRHYEGLLR